MKPVVRVGVTIVQLAPTWRNGFFGKNLGGICDAKQKLAHECYANKASGYWQPCCFSSWL